MDNWTVEGEGDSMLFGVAEIGSTEPSDPVPIVITNRTNYTMGGVSVGARGEGKDLLQFAADVDGAPGVWAAVGQDVTPGKKIAPDGFFTVWTRIIPPDEHEPGRIGFQINIDSFVVG